MGKKKSPALRSVGDSLTNPQTRQERYLANIAGLVATKPEYPFTRLERYLDAIAQSTGGSAEAIEELKQTKLNVYGRGVNLLDNWYFVGGGSQQGGGQFPINQRGVTQYTNAGEFIFDRWKLVSGSAVLVSGGVTLNGTIQQTREQSIGQTVVASALCSDGTMLTPTYNDSSKIFTLTASGKTIVAVKLEAGTVQTLARNVGGNWVLNDPPPNFQQELAKCQRYYERIKLLLSVGQSGNYDQTVPYKVTKDMSKTATVNIYSANYWDNGWVPIQSGIEITDNDFLGYGARMLIDGAGLPTDSKCVIDFSVSHE